MEPQGISTDQETTESRYVTILPLDAGGVRCLSSLLLLEELMKGLARDPTSGKIAKPCDHFDLICGTEWGGVLAIMLGRMKMVRESPRSTIQKGDSWAYCLYSEY
jgi:patatin-like phospholipase/acyl hydrolase